MASVTVQTKSAAGVTSGAEVKPFTNGKVSFSETIRGGDVIQVTGLPTGAAYTITESGLDAGKYTDRKSTRLNSSHSRASRMPSSA